MVRQVVAGRKVGELEVMVLQELWASKAPLGPRELMERLPGKKRAYTTIMTILARLIEKGLAERFENGRTFVYQAAGNHDQLVARAIGQLIRSSNDPRIVLAHLVKDFEDPELINELQDIVSRIEKS
jgi:predicted transcriptional regulator